MELTQPQIRELEGALRKRQRQLNAEVNDHLQKTSTQGFDDLKDTVGDTGDESVAHMMADLSLAEATRDVNELREIENALHRIADGAYGECADCGGEIEYERLKAYPAATRCVECQAQHEKTHATQGTPSL